MEIEFIRRVSRSSGIQIVYPEFVVKISIGLKWIKLKNKNIRRIIVERLITL